MRLLALAPLVLGLALAGPAAASTPAFGVFDLQADLAAPSRNQFGDVRISTSRGSLERRAPRSEIVRCASSCRFGPGWLAFAAGPRLTEQDVARADVIHFKGDHWGIRAELTARGRARWTALAREAARGYRSRGAPDVFVVVAAGEVVAQPYAIHVTRRGSALTLSGFSRAGAQKAAETLD